MSKSTVTLTWQWSTDLAAKNLGAAIHAFILASGLVQTTDTGQIDWTAPGIRPTGGSYWGYNIYKMSDASQAACPVFLKVDYSTGSQTYSAVVQMSVGSGTNGAGAFVGASQLVAQMSNGGSSNVGTWDWRMNYNPTLGVLNFSTGNTTSPLVINDSGWSLERAKKADGTPDARGCHICHQYANGKDFPGLYTSRYWPALGAFSTEGQYHMPAFWPNITSGASSAGGTHVAGHTPMTGNGTHGPLEKTLGLVVCGSSDFADGGVFTVNRWDGNPHTYVATRVGGISYAPGNPNIGPIGLTRWALLWE